jgi:hypothetical protein
LKACRSILLSENHNPYWTCSPLVLCLVSLTGSFGRLRPAVFKPLPGNDRLSIHRDMRYRDQSDSNKGLIQGIELQW